MTVALVRVSVQAPGLTLGVGGRLNSRQRPNVLVQNRARIDRVRARVQALALRLLAVLEQDYPDHPAAKELREQAQAW